MTLPSPEGCAQSLRAASRPASSVPFHAAAHLVGNIDQGTPQAQWLSLSQE